MLSRIALALIAAIVLRVVAAQSPPGFLPYVNGHLDVNFAGFDVSPAGITVPPQGESPDGETNPSQCRLIH
jgi:hypothetical protein